MKEVQIECFDNLEKRVVTFVWEIERTPGIWAGLLKAKLGLSKREIFLSSFYHLYELVKVVKRSDSYYNIRHPVRVQ